MSTYAPLNSALRIDKSTFLDDKFMLRLLKEIDLRLAHLYGVEGALQEATAIVREVALARMNEVLVPAIQAVLNIQERGFLIANSASPGTLGNGNVLTLVVDDEDQRAVFTPSPFVALTRAANTDDFGIARKISYDNLTGNFVCEVLSYMGTAGPHTDWVIGAVAGSTIAQYAMLEEAKDVRDETLAARDDTLDAKVATLLAKDQSFSNANTASDAADLATAKATLATTKATDAGNSATAAAGYAANAAATADEIEAMLATGAVVSINGRTGIVTGLAEAADVYTKTAADTLLAAKATAAFTYTKTEVDAALSAKAPQATTYTKTEVDTAVSAKANQSTTYTKTETDTLLAAKAPQSTTYTKTEVDTAIAAVNVGTDTFVASGAITSGDRLALRSDGKVEVVTGSETAAAIGTGQTITVSASAQNLVMASAYNVTAAKLAVLYISSSSNIYLVIGTISGTTISFGTPVSLGSNFSNAWRGGLAWNTAGNKIVLAYKSTSTVVTVMSFTVSGTVPTTVSTLTHSISSGEINYFLLDQTNNYVVVVSDNNTTRYSYNASTAALSSPSAGSVGGFAATNLFFHDPANARIFVVVWSSGSQVNVKAINLSAMTSSSNTFVASATATIMTAVLTADLELIIFHGGASGTVPMVYVVTFSGTTATVNTGIPLLPTNAAYASTVGATSFAVYDTTSAKVVVASATGSADAFGGFFIRIADPSSTNWNPLSTTLVKSVNFDKADLLSMVGFSDGVIAIRYRDRDNFGLITTLWGKVSGNTWLTIGSVVMSQDVWAYELAPILLPTHHDVLRNGRISLVSNTDINFQIDRIGDISTNADSFVGVAKATVANGANVGVTLKGGVASYPPGGLTTGSDYYLAADGTLTTTINGRKVGNAISTSKIKMAA